MAREISDVLLDQAQAMVDSQRAEQDKFATYLAEWYGVDAPEPTGDMQAAMELALDVIAGLAEAPNTSMATPGAGSPVVPLGVRTRSARHRRKTLVAAPSCLAAAAGRPPRVHALRD